MSAPQRIQMSRQRPWRSEHPDAVIVARPSLMGNPFRVGFRYSIRLRDRSPREIVTSSREQAVDAFRLWIRHDIDLPGVERPALTEIARELGGRDLACWCPLDEPCHADVLLDIANWDRS